jgi:uncharacterized protein (DUF1810 family)
VTLFAAADPDNAIFQKAIDRCFDGFRDPLTLQVLESD